METQTMNRRVLLKRMSLVSGLTLSSGLLSSMLSGCQAPLQSDYRPSHLSGHQLELLETLVELIIPTTDTPGAKAAGVHQFIDLAFAELYSEGKKKIFLEGLENLDLRSSKIYGKEYLQIKEAEKIELLEKLEGEKSVFFKELKSATIFAYYTSEIGASVEHQYVAMPGYYDGDVTL